MKIAVMSDVHGFTLALEVVRADIEKQGPFDEVIVAGDLCLGGPDPQGVIDIIRSEGWIALQGNTDYDLAEAAEWSNNLDELGWWIDHLSADAINYLANLPLSHRISPPGAVGPEHEMLVVHANPWNTLDVLDYKLPNVELQEIIGDEHAGLIVFGHIHIPFFRQVGTTTLIDISAVGNPKDKDLRSKYGIFTWDEAALEWIVEIRRLPYPLEETRTQIRRTDLPDPAHVLEKLHRTSY